MFRSLSPKKIKSAERVLEVLRYFNADREEATVMDIAREMGYPQSSTSELLRCLVMLGYLHRDRYARTYRPTARVALLGAWVQPKLFRQGHLLPMMDELAEATGATTIVASRMGTAVRYMHVVAPPGASPEPPDEGAFTPMVHSAMGKILLATYEHDQLRALIHRHNAETEDPALRVASPALMDEIETIRTRRYAVKYGEGGGAVMGVLLPRTCTGSAAEEQMALGIFAAPGVIQQNEEKLARILRNTVVHRLGAVRLVPQSPAPMASSLRYQAAV